MIREDGLLLGWKRTWVLGDGGERNQESGVKGGYTEFLMTVRRERGDVQPPTEIWAIVATSFMGPRQENAPEVLLG